MSVPSDYERANVLLLALEQLPDRAVKAMEKYGRAPTIVVDFSGRPASHTLPPAWKIIPGETFADAEALRRDFLSFLDAWPRCPLTRGKSFDELFRHEHGYSVWWTGGPGSSRQPSRGPLYPRMRSLWICGRAIEAVAPRKVAIFTRDRRLAAMLASQCRQAGLAWEHVVGSARPRGSAYRGLPGWLIVSLVALVVFPVWLVLRAAAARMTAGRGSAGAGDSQTPAVVMTGWYPRHVGSGSRPNVWYWREMSHSLARLPVPVRSVYLLHTAKFRFDGYRKFLGLFYTGWSRLRRIEHLAPIQQVHAALPALFRAVPRQCSALLRYARLERTPAFRDSFQFAGADVSTLLVPALRRAVARMAKWAQRVDATAQSLRTVGNVQVVLVNEEFYPKGMTTIAAARQLGIPTVGVQHGTISPANLIYTIPAGHVEGAPTPDYFSVFGPYAREVVSDHGAFPASRVWVTGGARFDHLAISANDGAAARARLDLPADKFLVLLATQRSWRYLPCQSPSQAVFEAAAGADDLMVCVKIHPNDFGLEEYRALARQAGAKNVRFFRDNFDDLVAACDVLVSGSSTTMIEALLAGKATICLDFWDEAERYPFVADGGSLGATSVDELRSALDRLRHGQDDPALLSARRKFLERHMGPTWRGEAAATLAGKIAEHFLEGQALARCA